MSETLGRFLAASRLKQGLAIDEVAQATRFNSKFIRAIEEDRFDLLPSKVFAKGFLRAYAKELGLDGDDIVARYNALDVEMRDDSPELISMPLRTKSKYTTRILLASLVFFVIALITFYNNYKLYNNKVIEVAQEVLPQEQEVEPAEILTEQQEQNEYSAATEETEDVEQVAPVVVIENSENVIEEAAPVEQVETVEPVEPVSQSNGVTTESDKLKDTSRPLNLTLSASSDSWIKVVVDGAITREIILREGKEVTWWAEKEYSLSIGNVAGTKLLLNGDEIPLELSRSNIIMNLKLPPDKGEANVSERQ